MVAIMRFDLCREGAVIAYRACCLQLVQTTTKKLETWWKVWRGDSWLHFRVEINMILLSKSLIIAGREGRILCLHYTVLPMPSCGTGGRYESWHCHSVHWHSGSDKLPYAWWRKWTNKDILGRLIDRRLMLVLSSSVWGGLQSFWYGSRESSVSQ